MSVIKESAQFALKAARNGSTVPGERKMGTGGRPTGVDAKYRPHPKMFYQKTGLLYNTILHRYTGNFSVIIDTRIRVSSAEHLHVGFNTIPEVGLT